MCVCVCVGGCIYEQAGERAMLREVGHLLQPTDGQTREAALWVFLIAWLIFKRKGYRCNFNRFMGFIVDGRQLLNFWHFHWFRTTFVALECDMVGGAKMRKHLTLKNTADPGVQKVSTSSVQADEKAIRACSQNAVAISCLVLGDPRNRRTLACILHASEGVSAWHGIQNVECRDVHRGSKWFLGQMHGAFMEHCFSVLTSYKTPAATEECGFKIQLQAAKAMSDEEVLVEDDSKSRQVGGDRKSWVRGYWQLARQVQASLSKYEAMGNPGFQAIGS